jgi:fucose permease
MAYTLNNNSWRLGYVYVGLLLLTIAMVILFSFKSWDEETVEHREEHHAKRSIRSVLLQKGVRHSLAIFLIYVHIESLLGVFVASYAYLHLQVNYASAALFTMTYFLALTLGRITSGLLSEKIHPNTLILVGEIMMLVGGILLLIPSMPILYYYISIGLIGIGSGPVFPNMMHMNPYNFSKQAMSRIMSTQMIVGYLGFGILTPIMGQVFQRTTIDIYPYVVIFLTTGLLLITIRFVQFQLHKTNEKAA